jgi:hypothetical protein
VPQLRQIFELLKDPANQTDELELHKLSDQVPANGLPPYAVYKFLYETFRTFARLGLGQLTIGRREKKTRFNWYVPVNQVISATSDPAEAPSVPNNAILAQHGPTMNDSGMKAVVGIAHQFPLRPGHFVKFELPPDFTASEAERFARFIQSLPLNA